jgi:hypothetical protein
MLGAGFGFGPVSVCYLFVSILIMGLRTIAFL